MQKASDDSTRLSRALSRYGFSTPDIRDLMSQILFVPSDRTIKKYRRVTGQKIQIGRRRVSPNVKAGDLPELLEMAHTDLGAFGGNMLHLLQAVQKSFGLAPRQFLNWMGEEVRRGGMTLRPCLHCGSLYPSTSSGDRVGPCCHEKHRKLLRDAASAVDDPNLL